MTISPDEAIYMRKAAQDRRRFYEVTGRTYLEQLNIWRERYDQRKRKLEFSKWLQKRLAFIRRVAL